MALPERLFYTLDQAAEKAKCSVDDLFHYAYMGVLQLCFLVPSDDIVNDYYDDIDIEDEIITIKSDGATLNDIPINQLDDAFARYETMCTSISERTIRMGDYIEHDTFISGLLALDFGDARQLYYERNTKPEIKAIGICTASLPRVDKIITKTDGYEHLDFEFSAYWYMKISNLYISHYELELLKNGGEYYWFDENAEMEFQRRKQQQTRLQHSPKSLNAQAKFIKALITANYGIGVANNVRWNIDTENSNKNEIGKIRQHFQTKGLGNILPDGKTVHNWIKNIELDLD